MSYDGTTPLYKAVAELIGCSPKSNNKLSQVVKKTKVDLGITTKARKPSPETNQQIYNYLVEKYSQKNKPKPALQISGSPHPIPVEINSQDTKNKPVEIFSHTTNFDNVRIAFYIIRKGKRERQVISLDGYFINALLSIGISKQEVPQWVQSQVNEFTAFDALLPITRQVKYLIMREVVKGLSGSDDVFNAHGDD